MKKFMLLGTILSVLCIGGTVFANETNTDSVKASDVVNEVNQGPEVFTFEANDAEAVKAYMKSMGYDEENIKVAEEASSEFNFADFTDTESFNFENKSFEEIKEELEAMGYTESEIVCDTVINGSAITDESVNNSAVLNFETDDFEIIKEQLKAMGYDEEDIIFNEIISSDSLNTK